MLRVDGIALRVDLGVVAAVLEQPLGAVMVRLAEGLEVAPLEGELGVQAMGPDMVDGFGWGVDAQIQAEAAPWLVGQHLGNDLVAPAAKVVEPRHGKQL